MTKFCWSPLELHVAPGYLYIKLRLWSSCGKRMLMGWMCMNILLACLRKIRTRNPQTKFGYYFYYYSENLHWTKQSFSSFPEPGEWLIYSCCTHFLHPHDLCTSTSLCKPTRLPCRPSKYFMIWPKSPRAHPKCFPAKASNGRVKPLELGDGA